MQVKESAEKSMSTLLVLFYFFIFMLKKGVGFEVKNCYIHSLLIRKHCTESKIIEYVIENAIF